MLVITLCASVTTFAKEIPTSKPESVGMSSAALKKVDKAVKGLIDKKDIAGAITMVARNGKIVHLNAQGWQDVADKKPMKTDTIMRFFSMTKPVTTVAAMICFEQGKLKPSDPVEKLVPEFKGLKVYQNGKRVSPKRKMTIADLMRHTSGLTYGLFGNTPVDQMYKKTNPLYSRNLDEMGKKLASLPLICHPREKWIYSASTDVLGLVIERASKMRLDKFMYKYIFKPLDMGDTAFYVPKEKIGRYASYYNSGWRVHQKYNKDYRVRETKSYLQHPGMLSGGGGLTSTARDYMRFCQMLINGGKLFGKQILKASTVKAMTKNQLPKGVRCNGIMGFGLGFAVVDNSHVGRLGEYSWDGIASTHFWISPKDKLVVITLSQHNPFWGKLKDTVKPLIYRAIVKK